MKRRGPSLQPDRHAKSGEMFAGLEAWFSQSVSNKRVKDWVCNGGTRTDSIGTAMFVFSENAKSTDTEPLYTSEAYMNEHLAVFHASYIDACLYGDDIVLGRFFLPPCNVQEVINQFSGDDSWIFGKKDLEQDIQQQASLGENLTNVAAPPASKKQQSGKLVRPTLQGYINVDDLPQWDCQMTDFVVGRDGCQVFHV